MRHLVTGGLELCDERTIPAWLLSYAVPGRMHESSDCIGDANPCVYLTPAPYISTMRFVTAASISAYNWLYHDALRPQTDRHAPVRQRCFRPELRYRCRLCEDTLPIPALPM